MLMFVSISGNSMVFRLLKGLLFLKLVELLMIFCVVGFVIKINVVFSIIVLMIEFI